MQLLRQTKFVSLIASLLLAASQGARAGDYFTKCDTNADGVLSGSEVGAFVGFDADKDGEVSRKEYSAGIIQHQAKMRGVDLALFASRDGNQDGRLSGTETSGLEAADQNQDGRITEAELMLGMKLIRSKMASLMPEQLVMEAKRRFHLLDANEDNRLSGTEALGVSHYDTNSDGRVTEQEYAVGVVLDIAASWEESKDPTPPTPPRNAEEPVQAIVDAINRQDTKRLSTLLRPELLEIIDEPVLEYLLKHVVKSHGKIATPSKDSIVAKNGEQAEEKELNVSLKTDKEPLLLKVNVYDGAILGFVFGSKLVDNMNHDLYQDLFEMKDGQLDRFTKFYAPKCAKMIQQIHAKEDDRSFEMFHPEIQASVGRKNFDEVFELIRSRAGATATIDLEEAGVELDSAGNGQFFTVTHLVKGVTSTILVQHKFQFVGLQGFLTGIKVVPSKEEANAVPKVSDDDAPTIK